MLVIIEGVDGSGKTTLVKNLADFGYKSIPNDLALGKMKECVFDDNIHIVDRSFVTDMVYRLSDDEAPKCLFNLREIATLLDPCNCKIIYCETKTAFEDAMKRGETNIVSKERSNKIVKDYHRILMLIQMYAKVPMLKYDYHKTTQQDVIKFINDDWI